MFSLVSGSVRWVGEANWTPDGAGIVWIGEFYWRYNFFWCGELGVNLGVSVGAGK